ncbi:hypothetical protein GGR54DRAFT_376036 [Hypoxylon sp. NC1633]|nr:hypothetical protein GGR54DRAFT_376036 [Hypoxylon sp. NC1633]
MKTFYIFLGHLISYTATVYFYITMVGIASDKSIWHAITTAYPFTTQIIGDDLFDHVEHLLVLEATNPILEKSQRPMGVAPLTIIGEQGYVDLLAVCVQAYGCVRSGADRCSNCVAGHGLWENCVVATPLFVPSPADAMDGVCACCYKNGKANECSLRFIPSAPPSPTSTSSDTLITVSTISTNPILVAHYRTMPALERERARISLEGARSALDTQLDALVQAEFAHDTNAGIPNLILYAYYDSMSMLDRHQIRVPLQQSLDQIKGHLGALEAAGRDFGR